MDKKEFNNLIDEISNKVKPINQLLYQSLILIVFYYVFDTIKKIQLHKYFIVLCAILFIILDLCIWHNTVQTMLFSAILVIYITFNINKEKSIDQFIDTMNTIKDENDKNIKEIWEKEEIERKNKNEIDKITFTPKNYNDNGDNGDNNGDNNGDKKQKLLNPEAYDKATSDINELHMAYKSTIPNAYITDSQYAKIMLNELYDTSQYKNINKNDMDKALDSDINNINNINTDTNTNLELFRKPKQIFLDNSWLSNKDYTYNDNCKVNKCIDTHSDTNGTSKNRNKNAICSVADFGKVLSECTNQSNTITNNQLDKISNNKIRNT